MNAQSKAAMSFTRLLHCTLAPTRSNMISTIILRMNLFTMTTIVAITLLLPAEVSSLASSFFRCSNYRMQLPAKAFLGVRPIASSSLPRSLTESKPLSLVGLSASNFIAGTQVLLQQGRTMSRKSKNICGTSTWRGRGKGHERVTDVGGVGPQGMVNKKDAENKSQQQSLPIFLDPGTKGGVIVLSMIGLLLPFFAYQISTSVWHVNELVAGRTIGASFTVITCLLWASTYVFRVATKDMTYAKQLKDYENAVIAKRLEELDEDEVQAIMEDIERNEDDDDAQ